MRLAGDMLRVAVAAFVVAEDQGVIAGQFERHQPAGLPVRLQHGDRPDVEVDHPRLAALGVAFDDTGTLTGDADHASGPAHA